MIRTLRAREKLVGKLPVTGELLRGSLLERTVRHTKDCPKCARGEGHQVHVLTVSYGGGRVRQFSVRRERVAEVRANLVDRDFSRVGAGKTPDAKTMGRGGVALGPEVIKQVHERLVQIARDKGATAGRRMRVDTTVVETDIRHPTDSTLLGDGVRVLTRIMRKITQVAGALGTKLRDP